MPAWPSSDRFRSVTVMVPVDAEARHEDRTGDGNDDRIRRRIGRRPRIARRRRRHGGWRRPGNGARHDRRARRGAVADALVGGSAVPFHRRLLVLGDPFAALVHAGDIELRLGRALLGERQPYLEGGGIIAARVGGLSVGLRQRERGRRRYKSNRSDEQAQPTHGGIPLAGNLPQITDTREGSPRPRTWLADYENVRTKNRREASN